MKNQNKRGLINYSFKRQVVLDLEQGKYSSPKEASKAYGIKGSQTVRQWCLKYGCKELLSKRIHIKTIKEIDEKKQLHQRIKELEAGLSDMTLNYLLEKNFLLEACKDMDRDVENFKKKSEFRLSKIPI